MCGKGHAPTSDMLTNIQIHRRLLLYWESRLYSKAFRVSQFYAIFTRNPIIFTFTLYHNFPTQLE